MSRAHKALVLAAGLGTRLRPFTCTVPKPLLPVWGEPMLARVVAWLRARGVDDIVVNCHYLHEQVERWCAENGCRASCEPEILGTGGALNPIRDWIGGEDFYLVNGDVVFEDAPELTLPADETTLGVALATELGPRTIEVEPECQFVTNWHSDDAGFPGTYTYCGVALLRADILKYVEPTGFSSVVQAYERAAQDGRFIRAVIPEKMLWTDAGTVASYAEVNGGGAENVFAGLPCVRAAWAARSEYAGGEVAFLGARGSNRAFFRLTPPAERPGPDAILILYDDATRPENARYAGHAAYLAARGVRVPEVLADLPREKATLFSWAGAEKEMSLEDCVHVVEALERFNRLGADFADPDRAPRPLEPAFDAALWKWERELFAEHCLGTRFCRPMPDAVREELENVAALLEKEPKALVHRDFQSSNVLWKNGAFAFIDFQGMRLGPAAYDLAAFVYDPYVTHTEGERRALVKLYAKRAGRPELERITAFAAVERLVQCLGAFGRLASVGQPQFGRHVLPALENLLAAADEAGLDATGALAEDLIAAERKNQELIRHAQGHGHDHACSCGHDHEHEHGHACSCGHAHASGKRS